MGSRPPPAAQGNGPSETPPLSGEDSNPLDSGKATRTFFRPAQREHGVTGSLLQRELKAIHIGDARPTRSHQGFMFDPYYR